MVRGMKEKQIEEMAKIIHGYCEAECLDGCYSCVPYKKAEALFNANYRKQEWISVEEALPENGTRVVGYDYESNVHCYFISAERWWIGNGWNTAKGWGITHWMPLPEPPKGE